MAGWIASGLRVSVKPTTTVKLSSSFLPRISAFNINLGTNLEPEFQPIRAGDVHDSQASLDRIQQALGYQPIVDFEEGLRRTLESLRQSDAAT
jgi:UDP-glucose 4-epimerase